MWYAMMMEDEGDKQIGPTFKVKETNERRARNNEFKKLMAEEAEKMNLMKIVSGKAEGKVVKSKIYESWT